MFFTRKYFYGEGTDHVIRLRPAEADAVNMLRLIEDPSGQYRTNLTESEMKDYDRAADQLNAYLETHKVFASDEFLAENDILRPVK